MRKKMLLNDSTNIGPLNQDEILLCNGGSFISTIEKASEVVYTLTFGMEENAIVNICAGIKDAFGSGVTQMIQK